MFRRRLTLLIRQLFHISNLTLYLRKKAKRIEKLLYRKKFSCDDLIRVLRESGVETGRPIIVHSAMSRLFNFQGSADDLIDCLIDFVGPNGTLCMPAYPQAKFDTSKVFDVRETKSAAGYLTEVFRKRDGVVRSLNQLHSVCAFGKDAQLIVGDHHHSRICFDSHSPYYIIGQLGGYIVDLGLPKYFIGTGCHVCEAFLYDKMEFFKGKFASTMEFTYKDYDGVIIKHTMLTKSKEPYIRSHSTKIIDDNFDKSKYRRTKISNIWVNVFDMKYLYTRLYELALEGKTIYKTPKMTDFNGL